MTISRADVDHVARLARLALSEEEKDALGDQLARILGHAQRVTALDTKGVGVYMSSPGTAGVLRPDVRGQPLESLTQEEALAGSPLAEAGHFRVPRILEEP